MSDQVWDAGLQPERTGLAWRRLGLTFLGLGLLLPKVAFAELGLWTLPGAAVALSCAALLLVWGDRRYAGVRRSLLATDLLTSGGRLPLAVTVATLVLGVTAAAFVLF